MSFYSLPTALEVGGELLDIRTDYRAVLDINSALCDIELSEREKAYCLLTILYEDTDKITEENIEEALKKALWFISGGKEIEEEKKHLKLMDWEQDFTYIAAPITKAIGRDIRTVEYMHWWTFLSYYYEIGDGVFANIVRIRNMLAKHQKMEKHDRDFYRENRDIIDFKRNYTDTENEILNLWLGGG